MQTWGEVHDKKKRCIIMIPCGLTDIGVMSVCMQKEINERIVTKSIKNLFNKTST